MIETLQNIDTQVFLALNSLRFASLDKFILSFSGQWIWVPMYIAIAWMMVVRYGWRKGIILIAVVGAAVGCSDFFCASVIRPAVERLRPANPDNPVSEFVYIVNGYRGGRYGFPSCHAANTFCLALISSLLMRRRAYTLFIFAWAVLQCYSRIYLGVHYPGDLLVGAAVGTAFAMLVYFILRLCTGRGEVVGQQGFLSPRACAPMWPLVAVTAALLAVMALL